MKIIGLLIISISIGELNGAAYGFLTLGIGLSVMSIYSKLKDDFKRD